ncbi:MAG: hypothetical protein KC646_13725 [Candidatus Cloacimonetes bacterium]|nr:hypothetical protein [Candidatus Cloacimonadota bacterium]
MKKSIFIYMFLCTFTSFSDDLKILQAKVNIRETKKRAQLSLKLQIRGSSYIADKTVYEQHLLSKLKQGLQKAILKKSKLKFHKEFTHLFITCWDDSPNEELLAMFTKIPRKKFPTINIYPRKLSVAQSKQLEQPLTSMFQQVKVSNK